MALFSKKQPDIPRRRHAGTAHTPERVINGDLDQRYVFRRNRTITGSISSHVASTNESHAHLKSSRVHAHELVQQRNRIGGILGLTLLGVVSLSILVSQFTAQSLVRTSDVTQTLDPVYTRAVDDYLSRQPIERLRFLLREDALDEYVQSVAPEVASIRSDGFAGLGKSVFVIEMRRPIAAWNVRGTQQYVDATGTAFVRNQHAKPSVEIVDNSGVQAEAGQAVASNQFLGFVGRVVGLANVQQYTVTQVIIPQGTTRQIELRVKNIAYPVKLSVDRSAGEQIEDMSRAINWLRAHNLSPEYLDVRVSGRAYYR